MSAGINSTHAQLRDEPGILQTDLDHLFILPPFSPQFLPYFVSQPLVLILCLQTWYFDSLLCLLLLETAYPSSTFQEKKDGTEEKDGTNLLPVRFELQEVPFSNLLLTKRKSYISEFSIPVLPLGPPIEG